jgi:hypothetical protein
MIANYHGCPRVVWQGRTDEGEKGRFPNIMFGNNGLGKTSKSGCSINSLKMMNVAPYLEAGVS